MFSLVDKIVKAGADPFSEGQLISFMFVSFQSTFVFFFDPLDLCDTRSPLELAADRDWCEALALFVGYSGRSQSAEPQLLAMYSTLMATGSPCLDEVLEQFCFLCADL